MTNPTHKLFVDDSGTKEYPPPGKTYSVSGGVSPYFVYGGLLVSNAEAGRIDRAFSDIKRGCFGTEKVEIKANWLRMPVKRQKIYLEKFGLDDARLDRFTADAHDLLASMRGVLLSAIINKEQVLAAYGERAWYAPTLAYEMLAQRVQLEMEGVNGICHVTVDDMSGATPSGRTYRDNLRRHHKILMERGSQLRRGTVMSRLAGLSFADSATEQRIQLADLVSYSVNRQFVDHGAAWDAGGHVPTYANLARIIGRFARDDRGSVVGYGIVKFPRTRTEGFP